MAGPTDKAQIAKQILSMIAGMALGGGAGGTAGALGRLALGSSFGGGTFGAGGVDQFKAKGYPTEFAPMPYHEFDVNYDPSGVANNNSQGKANASIIAEAGIMQDLDLHNRTITKYVRPGMTPRELRMALDLGQEEEKRLPQYWNESTSRLPFAVSSSAVKGIRITPEGQIQVKWGGKPSPKNPSGWYTFKQYPNTYEASKAAQELLMSDSIGRAVYPIIYRKKKNPNFQPKTPGLGSWNRKNYDASMAV